MAVGLLGITRAVGLASEIAHCNRNLVITGAAAPTLAQYRGA